VPSNETISHMILHIDKLVYRPFQFFSLMSHEVSPTCAIIMRIYSEVVSATEKERKQNLMMT